MKIKNIKYELLNSTLNYRLNDRNIYLYHNGLNISNNPLNINVDLIIKNDGTIDNSLNIELEKLDNDTYKITYSDGSIDTLDILYYYLNDNNERLYVDKEDVTINPDGSLEYEGYNIKTYYKNDNGFSLTGDYDDFINSNNISFKNEEIEKLELEILNIERNIKDLEYQNSEYGKVFDSTYTNYIYRQKQIEQLSHNNFNLQVGLNSNINSYYAQLYYLKNQYCNTLDPSNLEDNIKIVSNSIEQASWNTQQNINNNNSNINSHELVLLSNKNYLEQRYNPIRNTYYNFCIQNNNKLITYYNKLKTSKEYELNSLKRRIPILFLINKDKSIIYGFNEYNKLCYIFDKNGNQLSFEFINNNIKSITSNDNKTIELNYNSNDELINITNDIGNNININYENNKVISISCDEDITNITYYNNKLDEIIDNGGIGYKIYYDNDNISRIDKINSNNNSKELHNYTYNNNLVKIVDKTKYKIKFNAYHYSNYEYTFDHYNSLLTEIETIDDNMVNISGYEYDSNHCGFSFHMSKDDHVLSIAHLALPNSNQMGVVTIPEIMKTDYTLYARLQANSYQNINEYRTTSYCSHIYNVSDIKYEIRVELTYPDEIITYGASLNPNIIGEQSVALPVTLKEDEYGKAIKPNSFHVYVDYSNNNGNFTVKELLISECSFKYVEFNSSKQPKELWYSDEKYPTFDNSFKTGYVIKSNHIEYKYNINELKEEEISYINYEQYDTNNVLINNVEKTLSKKYYYDNNSNIIKIIDSNNNVILYEYDDNGNNIKKVSYNLKDSSNKIIEESTHKEDGTLSSFKNELGYEIKHNNSLNESFITSPNGFIISLDNNSIKSNLLSHSSLIKNGKLDNQILGNVKYSYTYDEWKRESSLSINDNLYMTFEYNEYLGNKYYISKLNDNTGYIKITDMYDKILRIDKFNNETQEPIKWFGYDNYSGKLVMLEDNYDYRAEYLYIDNHIAVFLDDYFLKAYANDIYGNLIKVSYNYIDTYYYSYNEDNNISGLVHNDYQENIIYDSINRIKELNSNIILNNYEYLNVNNRTTNLIKNHKQIIDNRIINNKYDYDKCGNIIKSNINHNEDRYYYDGLNRIIRCDIKELNHTYTYSYDENNNIISKGIHDLSYNDELLNSEYIDFNYDKDNKLISYDNYQITYDNSFRPTNYKNNNLVWFNNKLLSYGDNQYEYDFNGLRNKKITSNGTYEYIRDDDKLIKETITSGTSINGGITGGSSIGNSVSTITYNYGLNGIIGFTLESNNTTKDYYYIKNIFNDVIEIIDDNYNTYAKYSYDIFGKCNIITNVDDIANINPIRYRSYYYDNESGLYYLNSRYYDPDTQRFISMDDVSYLDYNNLGGLNLWVYCNNNPIMNVNPEGTFGILAALLVGLGIGALTGGTISGVVGYINGDRGWNLLGDIVGGAIAGAGIGVATVLGSGIGSTIIFGSVGFTIGTISISGGTAFGLAIGVSTITSGLGYMSNVAISSNVDFSLRDLSENMVMGLLSGAISFGAGYVSGLAGFRVPFAKSGIEFKYKVARVLIEKALSLPKYLLEILEKLYEN